MSCDRLLTRDELIYELNAIGDLHYHHNHPFNKRMHSGQLTRDEIRCWIKDRFYYQNALPIKDAIVASKIPYPADSEKWSQRIVDQKGNDESAGGIEAWIMLGEGAGISRSEMLDMNSIPPAAKSIVDSYVDFCREHTWLEAVASSLTELFAPRLIAYRVEVFKRHYNWINTEALEYFFNRLKQAPRDSAHALQLVITNATTIEGQNSALGALRFKCGILWKLLDEIEDQCKPKVENK